MDYVTLLLVDDDVDLLRLLQRRFESDGYDTIPVEGGRQAGIAPWVRDRLPLLWVDGELAAVAETWVAAAFAAPPNAVGARLRWSRPEGLPWPVSASG